MVAKVNSYLKTNTTQKIMIKIYSQIHRMMKTASTMLAVLNFSILNRNCN